MTDLVDPASPTPATFPPPRHGLVVAFDVSSPRMVVAVGAAGTTGVEFVAGTELDDAGRRASVELAPAVRELVTQAGGSISDVTGLACGVGPGTFTGTRVALATAKGMALGRNIGIAPLCSLSVLAASVETDRDVWALLDARKGEVYAARVRIEGDTLLALDPARCCRADTLNLEASQFAIGPGAAAYREQLADRVTLDSRFDAGPTARGLFRAARAQLLDGSRDPGRVRARYLRASYAELGVHPGKRPPYVSPLV